MKTIYLHTIAPELMCLGYKEEMVLNIARIANAVQVTICLLVSTSVY